MPKKQRKFADDGWAVWIEGDDTSTIYINDWLNPNGRSFIDVAIRIRRVKSSKSLNLYVPFKVSKEEIEDISLQFDDIKVLQAVFSATCLVDYMKNKHTSEIAYNGKTIDIVHISTLEYETVSVADGTLINISFGKIQQFLDNDEAYLVWRMPHKSLDEMFKPRVDMDNAISRFRDLITLVEPNRKNRTVIFVSLCGRKFKFNTHAATGIGNFVQLQSQFSIRLLFGKNTTLITSKSF